MDRKDLIRLLETLVTYVNKDSNERESGIAEGIYNRADNASWLAYNDNLVSQVSKAVWALNGPRPLPFIGIVITDGVAKHAVSDNPDHVRAVLGELFVTDQDGPAGERTPLALLPVTSDQAG